jgi:hypothetical protein
MVRPITSCLSSLYPVAQGRQLVAYVYTETEQRTESTVLPPFTDSSASDGRVCFTDPPFVPPPAQRIRLWHYWMMSRRLATPPLMLTTTDFGLMIYAIFVVPCDEATVRLGIFWTRGQDPLIANVLDGWMGGLVSRPWPQGGGWPWALAGSGLRFF